MKLSKKQITDFQLTIWDYYDQHARVMPWRSDPSFYHVLVSELMLQQTQVSRVIPKFEAFVRQFPTIESLATAQLADVIIAWQGLGYNRRAKYLHNAAQSIVKHGIPDTVDQLIALPGVGINTAGAIRAYVFNQPVAYIETNIRTVYIHEFFAHRHDVRDSEILAYVTQTIDADNPREWYYALMDYGVYLKQTDNHLAQSRQYKKQSPLRGSVREMRGRIVRLLSRGTMTEPCLVEACGHDDRVKKALDGLLRDGLIEKRDGQIGLTASVDPS